LYTEELLTPHATLKLEDTPCHLSLTIHYVHSYPSCLEAVSSIHNLRTCNAVVTGTNIKDVEIFCASLGCSVSIMIRPCARTPDLNSWQGQGFLSLHHFISGATQLPVQWISGALSLGVKHPGHEACHSSPSSAEVKHMQKLLITPLLLLKLLSNFSHVFDR
jgi:hypothetical protein